MIEPRSPALQADSLPSEPPGQPGGSDSKELFFVVCVTLQNSELNAQSSKKSFEKEVR